MKQFAVLSTPESWYFNDLLRAAEGRYRLEPVTFRHLSAGVGLDGTTTRSRGCDLQQFDAVIVRTMPPGSLEQVVFRMDVLGRLEAAGVTVINSARAIETSVDKYLASAKLESAGLLVPRTIVCQTSDAAMDALHALGGKVVVKPLFGSEGRGITLLSDEALAIRAFKMLEQLGAVLYLQEFIDHEGMDLRVLVVGTQVFGMRRRNALDWRTNVSRGATTEPYEPSVAVADMARKAATAVGAQIAGVDILPSRKGHAYVIEVNAVPGWRALSTTLQTDIARVVLDYVDQATSSA